MLESYVNMLISFVYFIVNYISFSLVDDTRIVWIIQGGGWENRKIIYPNGLYPVKCDFGTKHH